LAARFVRDEEAAGSNPATPTGKRQVTEHIATCRLHYTFSGVRFWEPVGSDTDNGESLGPRLTPNELCLLPGKLSDSTASRERSAPEPPTVRWP
jgi:hypothetical protein